MYSFHYNPFIRQITLDHHRTVYGIRNALNIEQENSNGKHNIYRIGYPAIEISVNVMTFECAIQSRF